MSVIDEVLQANEHYAQQFTLGDLPKPPGRKLAVVACMDARVTVEEILGLKTGDAHIIRNAGGIVTDDVMRSLIISHHLLGAQEFMLIHHTDCGMLSFQDDELMTKLQEQTGTATVAPTHFHAFQDLEADVRHQAQKIESHPWIPDQVLVRGFIFDVKTGALNEVTL